MFAKPRRRVDRVFVHCSASDAAAHDNVEVIRSWHLKRGWRDIGYHFVITRNGVLRAGRPLSLVPAAQKGHNIGSIAVCLTGLRVFTVEQMQKLVDLCVYIDDAYEIITFHGHCEVANKLCPVFSYKEVLRLDARGKMLRG